MKTEKFNSPVKNYAVGDVSIEIAEGEPCILNIGDEKHKFMLKKLLDDPDRFFLVHFETGQTFTRESVEGKGYKQLVKYAQTIIDRKIILDGQKHVLKVINSQPKINGEN